MPNTCTRSHSERGRPPRRIGMTSNILMVFFVSRDLLVKFSRGSDHWYLGEISNRQTDKRLIKHDRLGRDKIQKV